MPSDDSNNIKKSLAFLKTRYSRYDGYRVNLVCIDPHSEDVTGRTRDLDDPEIESFLTKNYDKRNTYYSVNTPHSGAPDGKLKKEHIGFIHAVWIDADPDKEKPLEEERVRLKKFAKELMCSDHPPTYITDSGGGIQAFWCLEQPVPVTPETKAYYEGINRALAQKYGTDSVHNIDRLMRLPYTWNIPTKKKKGRTKALAKCTRISAMYDKIDWIEPVMAAESENDSIDYVALDWNYVRAPMSDDLTARLGHARERNQKIDDLWNGRLKDYKPSRSEQDFVIAKELKSAGFNLNDTGAIMWNFPYGKGDELTKREIVRCYERSGIDFVNSIDPADVERIKKQVNPILAARAAGTILDEDLSKSTRFRSVKLHEMNWKKSGRPIYRDFIYEKAITVIYGKSNTGKSFLATDIAGHVALGRNWNGIEFEPEEASAVLYICAEAGQSFAIRGQALIHRLGVKELPFFVITEAPAFASEDKTDAKAIIEEIKRIERENGVKVGLVVIDTLAVTFQGDENSSKDMGSYVKNMKYIQHQACTGVLIVHHSGKDQAAGARGSSALQAATDTEMEVKSEKRGERYRRQVEVKKQRTGKAGMEVKFGLFVKELGEDDRGKPIDSCYLALESDDEFEFVSLRLEDELTGTKRAAYLTLQKFQEPDHLKWCKERTKREIRRLMIKHWFFTKNNPEKILSFEDLQKVNANYHYDSESSNFSGDYREIRQYLDNKELSLDQWIEEFLVIPAQALSE